MPKSKAPRSNPIVELLGRRGPLIMGILNTTPDSFSDGGAHLGQKAAIDHALELVQVGADIIDIGGESTRPGAKEVSVEEEIARTIPIITAIREQTDIAISIDTRKPQIAEAAIGAGANLWNDVSALTYDKYSIAMAAKLNVPIVLMHFQGLPENMQENPQYRNVLAETMAFLSSRIGAAIRGGVRRENLIVDVGIGFGKSLNHNLELMANLQKFHALGLPMLFGASRKSFIKMVDNGAQDPMDRLGGSLAAALIATSKGAKIIRVHDVKATKQALGVQSAISRFAL